MATLFGGCSAGEAAIITADTSTIMEIMGAATTAADLVEFGISFDGTSSTQEPILINLYQITATGTGTAVTEVDLQRTGITPNCQMKYLDTAEPTLGTRIAAWEVHPQGGVLVVQYPLGDRPAICRNSASQGLAWVATSASGVTPNFVCYAWWEE